MTRVRSVWIPFLALLVLGGCGEAIDDRAIVDELRVLAVRAEPPEAAPGDTVALSALVADPLGGGRALAWSWWLCEPDPLSGAASCAEGGTSLVPLGTGTALDIAAPALPEGADAFVVLAIDAPAGGDAPAQSVASVKRLRISTVLVPNANPAIGSFDGEWIGERVELTAAAAPGSAEDYLDAGGEPATEELTWSWFASEGELDRRFGFGADASTTLVPGRRAAVDVWAVLRDPRGGVAWAHRVVTPPSAPVDSALPWAESGNARNDLPR